MQKISIIAILIFFTSLKYSYTQGNLSFGGNDNDVGYALTKTVSEGVLLVGTTRSFGEGSEDIYLVELDKNFKLNYSKTLGFVHRDVIRSVIRVNDGYILGGDQWDFGMARSDMSIQKIDFDGNFLWRNSFGTHYTERGFDVIANREQGYYALGYSRGYQPLGDVFLVKTDHSGNEIWRNTYGYENDDYGFEMIEDDSGDLLIIGSKNSFFDDVHGNYKIHDADVLLLKINKEGDLLWTKTFGGTNHDFGYSIEVDAFGGYYLFGATQSIGNGKFDANLLKVDHTGELEWQKTFGGSGYDYGYSMTVDEDNNLFLIGTTKSYGNSADILLIKTSDNGEAIWTITLGGDGFDAGYDVINDNDGCVLVGKVENLETSHSDMAVFKIDKNGNIEDITKLDDLASQSTNFSIGPNPMSNTGHIFNNKVGTYQVTVSNSLGMAIRSFTIGQGQTDFNRNGLPAGLYVFTIFSETSQQIEFSGKLIIH